MEDRIVVGEIGPEAYSLYAQVTPEFVVESSLDCESVDGGLGGFRLRQTPVDHPYRKYDHDEDPPDWARKYDLSKWGVFLATVDRSPVGGAAVAPPMPGIVVAEGRHDRAALFDIRVSPEQRRRGIGTALLHACAEWAQGQGFAFLDIETQNVNVPACRFYAGNGCELVEIRRFAYAHCPEFAHEAMLIWRLALRKDAPAQS